MLTLNIAYLLPFMRIGVGASEFIRSFCMWCGVTHMHDFWIKALDSGAVMRHLSILTIIQIQKNGDIICLNISSASFLLFTLFVFVRHDRRLSYTSRWRQRIPFVKDSTHINWKSSILFNSIYSWILLYHFWRWSRRCDALFYDHIVNMYRFIGDVRCLTSQQRPISSKPLRFNRFVNEFGQFSQ